MSTAITSPIVFWFLLGVVFVGAGAVAASALMLWWSVQRWWSELLDGVAIETR